VHKLIYLIIIFLLLILQNQNLSGGNNNLSDSRNSIYHNEWNDLNKNGEMDPYENSNLDIELRITDLLQRMTLEEKTCQMATLYGYGRVVKDELPTEEWLNEIWKDGIGNIDEHLNRLDRPACETEYSWPASKHAIALNEVQKFFIEKTRLGIPVDFTNEGIRGVCNEGSTNFPAQIGVGSTWDLDLISKIGHVTGKEARALGYTNVYSPILDLARDPRWGRVVECYGEDPYMVSEYGVAQVSALQKEGVVSTPKHFGVYSVPKGGRDGLARTDPNVSLREMLTMYVAPFRAAFTRGGALGVMSSYNDYDGIPVSGSKYFLTELLREKWGFKGYVVSDSRAVDFIFSKHHVAKDYKDAVRQSVEAGLNIRTNFTMPDVFIKPLRDLVKEDKISISTINSRVRDILRVKFILGLFDKPYIENPDYADQVVGCDDHQKIALEASRKSIVLLKNENNILPLSKNIKSVLVVGPNADAISPSLSRYGPSKIKVITVLEGIKNLVGAEIDVKYTKGCEIFDKNWPESEILPILPSAEEKSKIEEAKKLTKQVDAVIVVLGGDDKTTGESLSRTSLDLPGYQLDLVKTIYKTGIPTIVVLINGRPLTINWISKHVPAIVEAWFPGSWGGQAVAEVLFGDYNPGGKLPVTFPKTVGQIPLNFPYKPGSHAGVSSYRERAARVTGVLYPFGHGLSYTEFEYSNLKISPKIQNPVGEINITVDVQNIGHVSGDEVVQLYINDEVSSITTYTKELKGFKRISLNPNEKKTINFVLTPDHLKLLDRHYEWVVESGMFEVMIGNSSEDIRLKNEFEIIE